MPRPIKKRIVQGSPESTFFKPRGVPLSQIGIERLSNYEFEAIRLRDYEGVDQKKACEKMQISQTTFSRIYVTAREKIAKALVDGKAIELEGF